MSKSSTVIVGSGLSALMLARMIKAYRDPEADIIIVEKEATVGGQFGSVNYNEYGYFDFGMHIYYESCIPEIDKLFTSVLPPSEWNILENNYKDVAGLYVNGKLQLTTPYVDLRALPESEWKKYAADILYTISKNAGKELPAGSNAYEILSHHFGKTVTDEVFVPVLDKLYLTHASNLDEIATKLTTINRVALFDEEVMLDLMQSQEVRARICFPNQFTLPPLRTSEQRGFYPKQYGMFRVLEQFRTLLEAQGVRFITSAGISDLTVEDGEAKTVTIKGKEGDPELVNLKEIFWTAGLPTLALALKVDISDLKNEKKNTESIYVNFLFDKKPDMGELYYFYCFDKGYRSFRVTSYSNYCPAAAGDRGFPVCVEIWAEESDSKDEKDIIALAQKELKAFGVIDAGYKTLFAKAEKLQGGGFPLPSLKNIGNMKIIRDRIRNLGIKNVIPTGVLAEENVFFIKDVLMDAYNKTIQKK